MNSITKPFSLFLFIVGACWSFGSGAQQKDSTLIANAVDKYIVGWRTADKEMLEEAFDMDGGVVLWTSKNGDEEQLNSMKLADLVMRNKRQENYGIGYDIQKMEIIAGQLAIVLVKIPLGANHYIDCLELQKINGKWKIVLKSFVYFRS